MTPQTLIKRAQAMCDADGKTRWIKYTSLGWRIELTPGSNEALPCYRIEPRRPQMSNYLWAGSLYRTQTDMLDEIAHRWLTAGGSATLEDVRGILLKASDRALASECIEHWELDLMTDPDDADSLSHMARHGYDASDLEHAFSRFREDIEHDLDVEARGDDERYEP